MGQKFAWNPITNRLDLVGTSGGGGDTVTPSTVLAKNIATAVPVNVKTTVVTLSAVADKYITAIYGSGMENGKWFLVINSADQIVRRAGPERDKIFEFPSPLKITAGSVLDIKVEHFVTGETPDFECTILGY
jgi:hypothetical protein